MASRPGCDDDGDRAWCRDERHAFDEHLYVGYDGRGMRTTSTLLTLVALVVGCWSTTAGAAVDTPSWLVIEGEHRQRFEHLEFDHRVHAGPRPLDDDSTALSLRTLLSAELRLTPVQLRLELLDARAVSAPGTPLDTTVVNPLDVLEANLAVVGDSVFVGGDHIVVRVGRLTLNLGSRRVLARNQFRNTINSFTGVDAQWQTAHNTAIRVFAVVPVRRAPTEQEALEDNAPVLDREDPRTVLAGLSGSVPLGADITMDVTVIGLSARDERDALQRELLTPGLWVRRAQHPGRLDFEIEAHSQHGTSTQAEDGALTPHLALSLHVGAGYQAPVPLSPHLSLHYDFASGDDGADDGANNGAGDDVNRRFDPLFGARRFEFGPTGLLGAVARSNLSSPRARLQVWLGSGVDVYVDHRVIFLASTADEWTVNGLRAPKGDAFVGSLSEARVRWELVKGHVDVEVGMTVLLPGRLVEVASVAADPTRPTTYFYTQLAARL